MNTIRFRRIFVRILAVLLVPPWAALAFAQAAGFAAYEAGRYEEAFASLLPSARTGNAPAQYVVGLMYANGQGVEQSFYEAAKMYRLAGEQGHAGAQVNLGSLYENCYGNGPCNAEAGANWYRRAAEQGDAVGQYNLAVMYAAGRGVAEDEWSARVLFRQAAEQGYPPAQFNLAVVYERGMGGPVDRIAAWAWFEVAAAAGHEGAAAARDRLGAALAEQEQSRAAALAEVLRGAYPGK